MQILKYTHTFAHPKAQCIEIKDETKDVPKYFVFGCKQKYHIVTEIYFFTSVIGQKHFA